MSVSCPYCLKTNSSSDSRDLIIGHGSFRRKSDQALVYRFRCKSCRKHFSRATWSPCYRQKKRHLNTQLMGLFASGISQRRLAFLFRVNRKTIIRKFKFLGYASAYYLAEDLKNHPPATEVEFDDLETFEHSKLKPLSVLAVVESHSRRVLGFKVAQMPAKGLLVKKSLKRFGKRKDERKIKRTELFRELAPFIDPHAVLKSDDSPHYPGAVQKHFPQCEHKVFKGRRGCVVGQGELKAGGFDPLFSLNHSYAMIRANVNRTFRRTWNTTKKVEHLRLHLAIYFLYHNLFLRNHPAR